MPNVLLTLKKNMVVSIISHAHVQTHFVNEAKVSYSPNLAQIISAPKTLVVLNFKYNFIFFYKQFCPNRLRHDKEGFFVLKPIVDY